MTRQLSRPHHFLIPLLMLAAYATPHARPGKCYRDNIILRQRLGRERRLAAEAMRRGGSDDLSAIVVSLI